jgi:exopolyphosphatase/guanosine-5'-triphosphate,3'-diphosphate pyrophosphatase
VRCACVDIGSNTTRLLVADCDAEGLREVELTRVFTRIGSALGADGVVPPSKIEELTRVVAADVERARELGAERHAVVATAALRDAVNSDEVLGAVAGACGTTVQLLSDEEEARLTFLGAAHTLAPPPEGSLAVVDVGGRSTEIALGSLAEGAGWARSFRIGSGLLADRHLQSDPPAPAQLEALRAHAREALAGVRPPLADRAVACGGSAGSLRRMAGDTLSRDSLEPVVALLASAPAAVVAERFALDAERVRLLPAGVLILAAVSDLLEMPLEVGNGGLREGVLLELATQGSMR